MPHYLTDAAENPTPIWPVTEASLEDWLAGRDADCRAWLAANGFRAAAGTFVVVPGEGGIAGVALGLGGGGDMWAWGDLAQRLPGGTYAIEGTLSGADATGAALAWALGTYRFDRYKAVEENFATLVMPEAADAALVERTARATTLVRDLVNTPAGDMAPPQLAEAAEVLAERHGAQCTVLAGDDLLMEGYPAIHAVGRASINWPRLIDIVWGDPDHPKVTLVGKGVCFDTGGLDLKPAAAMLKMKKDMGGAATVLGVAAMIMDAGLPVRLRVLIPAVENAVSRDSYRPGDILQTRKRLTVEVGNTDAEGRIVLCDALTEADHESPELLIDCATLTGAARVALGPDLPALFTDDDDLARDLQAQGAALSDPLWRMPLFAPYRKRLESKVADLNNVSDGPFAGAITAALYLQHFVEQARSWAHIDLYAWNDAARPGRPAGGEAMAMRALYGLIATRYPAGSD